ncbi:MAG: prolyl oligopeptidase family serine peptidase [Saprospiraceae bacterium]
MTPEVYKIWNSISDIDISSNGELIKYHVKNEGGDNILNLYKRSDKKNLSFPNCKVSIIDSTGRIVVFTTNLHPDSLKKLKIRGKNELPQDSFNVYDVKLQKKFSTGHVENFQFSPKASDFIYYTLKLPLTKDSTNKKDSSKFRFLGIVHNIATGQEDTIQNIKTISIPSRSNKMVCVGFSEQDTTMLHLMEFDLHSKTLDTLLKNQKEIKNFCWSRDGKKLSFQATDKKMKSKNKPYNTYLHYNKTLINITEKIRQPFDNNWVICTEKEMQFSKDCATLYIQFRPLFPEKDTTKSEDDIVEVEIWKYDMPNLYTQLEYNKDLLNKSILVRYDIDYEKVVRMGSDIDIDVMLTKDKNTQQYIIQSDPKPYYASVTWEGELHRDIYELNTQNGMTQLIAKDQSESPSMSSTGRFAIWYNKPDSTYHIWDTQSKTKRSLPKNITYFDTTHDIPALPGAIGIAGWMENDEALLVYDENDIWKVDPLYPDAAIPLTDGKPNNLVFRLLGGQQPYHYIPKSTSILLYAFNELKKNNSYYSLNLLTGQLTLVKESEKNLASTIIKAKSSPWLIFTEEDFHTFPDLYLSDTTFKSIEKISDANPFQKNFAWGKDTLVQWKNYKGNKNQGIFFYPANFDPNKKYPLIVNFYEKSSNELHRHRAPYAHRSTINYTYYTNNGYCVFNPDISYTVGQPGQDCYDAVMSGVDSLVRLGFIDSTKMGLQGHSWGGYQVAYLLTQTGRFACAESGAPVVNMISAYGGIRWGTGMSRMFQYEKTQSRLGKTLWEDEARFIRNSPIFYIDSVTTPVLILHNDDDGAVPWYQGIEYYMALRRLNKPAWLLNYNKEPHWPVKWQNRLDFNIRMQQFFDYYLKNQPLPRWMKEGNTPLEKGIIDKI